MAQRINHAKTLLLQGRVHCREGHTRNTKMLHEVHHRGAMELLPLEKGTGLLTEWMGPPYM
jgi:hypothetical protein